MSGCQERMGTKIKLEEKIVIFMAVYAAYLINRLEVGKDGNIAYEMSRPSSLVRSFCGRYVKGTGWKSSTREGGMECSLTLKATSGEAATKEGLQTVRSVRRIPLGELWNETNKYFVKHVPWNNGEDPEEDGDLPEALVGATATGAVVARSMDPTRVIVVNTKEVAPREFHIKKDAAFQVEAMFRSGERGSEI